MATWVSSSGSSVNPSNSEAAEGSELGKVHIEYEDVQ